MPRLWVLSDLHYECDPTGRRRRFDPPEFDILVNAGDTYEARPLECVERTARLADGRPAILVLGNHDLYGVPMGRAIVMAREAGARLGVHVLQGNVAEVEGLRFCGGTLWDRPLEVAGRAKRPDLVSIMSGDTPAFFAPHEFAPYAEPILAEREDGSHRPLTNIDIENVHVRTIEAIQASDADVVVTHYPPSDGEVAKAGKASLWVHGHIHAFERRHVGNTEVVLNAGQSRVFADRLVVEAAAATVPTPR